MLERDELVENSKQIYCDRWVTKKDKRRTASVLSIPAQKKK